MCGLPFVYSNKANQGYSKNVVSELDLVIVVKIDPQFGGSGNISSSFSVRGK